jgi:peptide/nickel transport system substrate-binding protein
MKSKAIWLILSCLLVLSLILTSCGTKTTQTTTPTTMTTQTTKPTTTLTTTPTTKPTTNPTATTGKWWDKLGTPQYGGTITIRKSSSPLYWDPYYGTDGHRVQSYYSETLALTADPTIDRAVWDFKSRFIPEEYYTGSLAESWEKPNLSTYIFHIRKGIRFQDKSPVNGRELTAYDVEYSWQRMLGFGYGFTKPSPYYGLSGYVLVKSVTATDKYTVEFKLSQPSYDTMRQILDNATCGQVLAHEAVEKWGDVNDWTRAIGSGPFILDDYVIGSSISYSRNPSYWGHDERYPQNQLPYVDKLKILIIPDAATTLAALRTGKLDILGGTATAADNLSWEQAKSLAKTNPELQQIDQPTNGQAMDMRVDTPPYNDIRVRKALNMAIDRDTIAKTYYGGTVSGTPVGMISPTLVGYYTPFVDWPKDVQEGYNYNPAGAKKLLAEAGFPNGFKTNCVTSSASDLDLLQVAKAYFYAIGVDMEIKVMDNTTYAAFIQNHKHDAMAYTAQYCAAATYPPLIVVANNTSSQQKARAALTNDPVYDEMYTKVAAALTANEQKQLIKDMDLYVLSHYWGIKFTPVVTYVAYQPWFNGYSGETYVGGTQFARYWIDQKLKK